MVVGQQSLMMMEINYEKSGNEKDTTNNRMELMAPINALKNIDPKNEIEIFTDSKYVKLE